MLQVPGDLESVAAPGLVEGWAEEQSRMAGVCMMHGRGRLAVRRAMVCEETVPQVVVEVATGRSRYGTKVEREMICKGIAIADLRI